MIKYHIDPETGIPNICNAKSPESCLYFNNKTGEEAPHFLTKEDARSYVEELMNKRFPKTNTLSKNSKPSKTTLKENQLTNYSTIELDEDKQYNNKTINFIKDIDNLISKEKITQQEGMDKILNKIHNLKPTKENISYKEAKEILTLYTVISDAKIKQWKNNMQKGNFKNENNGLDLRKISIEIEKNKKTLIENQSLNEDTQKYIAKTLTKDEYVTIAINPNAHPSLKAYTQKKIVESENINDKVKLIYSGNSYPIIDRVLATDKSYDVRNVLAKVTTDKTILEKLSKDKDPSVQLSVYKNMNSTREQQIFIYNNVLPGIKNGKNDPYNFSRKNPDYYKSLMREHTINKWVEEGRYKNKRAAKIRFLMEQML